MKYHFLSRLEALGSNPQHYKRKKWKQESTILGYMNIYEHKFVVPITFASQIIYLTSWSLYTKTVITFDITKENFTKFLQLQDIYN